MERFSRHLAIAALERIAIGLPAAHAGQARSLAAALDPDGTLSLAAAVVLLFPTAAPTAADEAMGSLVLAIAQAAPQASSRLRLVVDPDRRAGSDAQIWFEGRGPVPALPDLPAEVDYIADICGFTVVAGHRTDTILPVLETLHRWVDDPEASSFFVLMGDHGMGKTVACQRFHQELQQRRAADPGRRQPFYLDFRKLPRPGQRVPVLAEMVAGCAEGGLPGADTADHELNYLLAWMGGGAVVILDGLDDVQAGLGGLHAGPNDVQREDLAYGLLSLAQLYRTRYPGGASPRILLSCRPPNFPGRRFRRDHSVRPIPLPEPIGVCPVLEMRPLGHEQISRYVAAALPEVAAPRQIELIQWAQNQGGMQRRPGALALIRDFLVEFERGSKLGRMVHEGGLFRRMIADWQGRASGPWGIQADEKPALAAQLAAYLWRNRVTRLSTDQIDGWLITWRAPMPGFRPREARQMEEDLRSAAFMAWRDGGPNGQGSAGFHFDLARDFFLAEYLFQGARAGRVRQWDMPPPDDRVLDYLGERLRQEDDEGRALANMAGWRQSASLAAHQVRLAYAQRAHDRNWPPLPLPGIDLSTADLTEFRIAGLDLTGACFVGSRMLAAEFHRVGLVGADFSGADLTQVLFEDCDLTGARFDAAKLGGAIFRRCDLTGVGGLGGQGVSPRFLLCQGAPEPRLSIRPPDATLEWIDGQSGGVRDCAVSPDGRWIVTADSDGCLRQWDAASGELYRVLAGHSGGLHGYHGGVNACAIAPDGRWILSAGADGDLRIWDAGTGQPRHRLAGHRDGVADCAIAPDGSWILSAGDGGELRMWDAVSAIERPVERWGWSDTMRLRWGYEDEASACAISPDGIWAVTAGDFGELDQWDMTCCERQRGWPRVGRSIHGIVVAPKGDRIVTAGDDGIVQLWGAVTGELYQQLRGHQGAVTGCALSPDGRWIATAGGDGTVRQWDATTGRQQRILTGDGGSFSGCAISPDGDWIVAAGASGVIRQWDAASGALRRRMATGYRDAVRVCRLSADGRRLVAVSQTGVVWQWDALSGGFGWRLPPSDGAVWDCAISPDGDWIVTGGVDGALRQRDAATGELRWVRQGHAIGISACAISPDGAWIASASLDGRLRLWSAAGGEPCQPEAGGSQAGGGLSPDGNWFVTAESGGVIRQQDAAGEPMPWEADGYSDRISRGAVSPDGAWVVTADQDGTLRQKSTPDGEARLLPGHQGRITACAVSSDGARILSAGEDGTIRLWDVASGQPLRVHAITRSGGYAVWEPTTGRVIDAAGDAWRCLKWRLPGVEGAASLLPLDSFGELCRP